MTRIVNKVIVVGHLGKDAETNFTQAVWPSQSSTGLPADAGRTASPTNGKKKPTGTA